MAKKFGGHMTVRLSNGTRLVMRAAGEFAIEPSTLSAEAMVNQNGSIAQVLAPQTAKMRCDFEDGGQDFRALLASTGINVTVTERDTGVQHLFTDCIFTGSPSVNRKDGSVSGLVVEARAYRRQAA